MTPPLPSGIERRSPGSKWSSAAGTPRARGADPSNPTNLSSSARAAAELRLSKPTPRGDAAASASLDLVKQAETWLLDHEVQAQKKHVQLQTKKERIEALLNSAIEVFQSNGNEENCKILEQAIEVAQVAQVLPELRVKARRLIESQRNGANRKAQKHEQMLLRLVAQLEASRAEEREQSITSTSSSSSMDPTLKLAKRRHQEQVLLKQLAKGINDAPREGVPKDAISNIQAAMQSFEEKRRLEAKTEVKLRSLLYNEANVQELAEQIEMIRERPDQIGPAGNKLILEIEDKIAHSMEELRHHQWLRAELGKAADSSDIQRLQMLARQAQSLDLRVPPWVFKLLDKKSQSSSSAHGNSLEVPGSLKGVSQQDSTDGPLVNHTNSWSSLLSASDLQTNCNDFNGNACSSNSNNDNDADNDINDGKNISSGRAHNSSNNNSNNNSLSAAQEAAYEKMARLKDRQERFEAMAAKVEEDALLELEAFNWEQPRWADLVAARRAVKVARESKLPADRYHKLYQELMRIETKFGRRLEAEVRLRRSQQRHFEGGGDEEEELTIRSDEEVQREATEAELLEASKGHGRRGRERLEEAIQQAKRAGVAPERLKQANEHLRQLLVHEERSSLAAGNIRRLLEKIPNEPWRLQQVMDLVKGLRPLTSELERLVEACHQEVQKQLSLQSQVKEITVELRRTLDVIQTTRTAVSPEDMDRLEDLLKRAKSLEASAQPAVARTRGQRNPRDPLPPPSTMRRDANSKPMLPTKPTPQVPEALVEEGTEVLKSLRRDKCQRDAAEHRLHLAMKARNQEEIERSLRAVRALGPVFAVSPKQSPGTAPSSNRLVEEAGALVQQLGEGQARKEAALENLQECLKRCANPLEKDWFENVVVAIQEAKHCGVPSTILDQAKREVRSYQRKHEERALACEDLQRSLAQSQITPQQVLMKLRKVQRLGVPMPEPILSTGTNVQWQVVTNPCM